MTTDIVCYRCHKPLTFDAGDVAWTANDAQAIICEYGLNADGSEDVGHLPIPTDILPTIIAADADRNAR